MLEEHWNGVFDGKISASTFVARISCQLRWERRWAGVISEVEHEQEVLTRQADRDVHGHPDQEMSLGSASDVAEDEDQVDD